MTFSISVAAATVNTANLGGNQLNARTLAMRDGGHVVLWQDVAGNASSILMQRYDALGNPVGGTVVTSGGELTDACLTENGDIAFSTILLNTLTLQVRFLSGSDLALLGVSSLVSGVGLNSAQIEATSGGQVRVMVSNVSGQILAATADATLPTMTGGGVVATGAAGAELIETGGLSVPTFKYVLVTDAALGNGTLVDTGGNSLGGGNITTALDVLTLQPGFQVVMSATANSMTPVLTALSGNVSAVSQLSGGVGVNAAIISGSGTLVGAAIGSREMVNLGDGRILMIWAAERGSGTFSASSGIYASVYNVNAGTIEAPATLLRAVNAGVLQVLAINGTVLADGRVALTYVAPNGLSGNDVFTTILDSRIAGVTVAGTTQADMFVGTAFGDTFSAINFNDTIFGGGGQDSVLLTGSGLRQIDLADPDAFPGGGPRLLGIENLTGAATSDTFFGSSQANRLDGAIGNDQITGRAGDDTLIGGAGDDTLDGGAEDDRLDGGSNNDALYGGDGNDTLIGGTGNDRAQGGAGDDLLQGSDGNDVLNGGLGDDTLNGGIGNDTIATGGGADLVQAGDGDDLIHVNGSGNAISGDADIDTVSYARLTVGVGAPQAVYADLAGTMDPLAGVYGFGDTNDDLTTVENLIGSNGNDFLAGDAAANRLSGGGGDDVLVGRAGADTLIGGAGADIFVFDSAANGGDSIRDFNGAVDLVALGLGGFGDIRPDNIGIRFSASATAAAQANASAQLLFDNAGGGAGNLFFDADGNGAAAAVLIVTLNFSDASGLGSFGSGDFIFV